MWLPVNLLLRQPGRIHQQHRTDTQQARPGFRDTVLKVTIAEPGAAFGEQLESTVAEQVAEARQIVAAKLVNDNDYSQLGFRRRWVRAERTAPAQNLSETWLSFPPIKSLVPVNSHINSRVAVTVHLELSHCAASPQAAISNCEQYR